jgi:hypothetical protein
VRNSLCTSVTLITASSSEGIVMPMEALNAFLQNAMVTLSAYPPHIWEILCPETSCHEQYFTFPHSFHAVTMGFKLGHDYFLPHLLRSVFHWLLCSSTLKNFEITESIVQ